MHRATLGVMHVTVLSALLVSSIHGAAPLLCVLVLGLFTTLFAYLRFDELPWHHSADNELTFWLLFSVSAALIGLFASDASPIAFKRVGAPGVCAAVVYVAAVVVEKSHNDRQLRSFRRSASRVAGSLECLSDLAFVEASSAATTIDRICEKLDAFAPSGQPLFFGLWPARASRDEAAVERLLTSPASSGRDELNYILTHVNLARVLRVLRRSRHRLLDGLTSEASLASLSAEAKAALVDALQKVGLRAFGPSSAPRPPAEAGAGEVWAARVVLSVRSHAELLRLRKLLDSSGDYHSLHKLVFRDMRPGCRAAVLARIEALCADHRLVASRQPVQRDASAPRRLKIVSDIDDTLLSSGGHFPAGCDRRYPRRALYPGILELFRALHADGGSDGSGDLVLLSARPHTYKDLTEGLSYAYFARLRQANLLHATPTLLAGDLKSSLQIVTSASAAGAALEAVALKKLCNLRELSLLYPDYSLLLFGDNGQGDVLVAERMLRELRAQARLALIHLVRPLEQTFGWAEGKPAEWEALGLRFYRTAVGAACELSVEGLLSAGSLRDVCTAAARQLEALRPSLATSGQLALCLAEFCDDLERANGVLGPARAIPMPEPAAAAAAAASAPDGSPSAGAQHAPSRLAGLSHLAGLRLRARAPAASTRAAAAERFLSGASTPAPAPAPRGHD